MPEGWINLNSDIRPKDEIVLEITYHGKAMIQIAEALDLLKEMAERLEYATHDCLSPTPETCQVESCMGRLAVLKKFRNWK